MKNSWIWLIPVLFLPDLIPSMDTRFGVVDFSDLVIFPYIALLALERRTGIGTRPLAALGSLFAAFVFWALLSTLTVNLRYGYPTNNQLLLSIVRMGKFCTYAIAGLLTSRAVCDERVMRKFLWAMSISSVLLSFSLMQSSETLKIASLSTLLSASALEYESTNAMSVVMAMVVLFMSGAITQSMGTASLRRFIMFALPVAVAGLLVSRGRGGWIAFFMGMLYLLRYSKLDGRTASAILLVVVSCFFAYQKLPVFQVELDKTINPAASMLRKYDVGIMGIDEGGRFHHLQNEAPKILNAPIIGTGFFHRGKASKLWLTGSHNFFVQMFLETGVVGGTLILLIFAAMWRQSRDESAGNWSVPVRSSLIAAFVGGMSGEYFYGNLALYVLFSLHAPITLGASTAHAWRDRTHVQVRGV